MADLGQNAEAKGQGAGGALAVEAVDFSVHKAGKALLEGISLAVKANRITAIIGPTASGKSLFLRCINRLVELEGAIRTSGQMKVFGQDVYGPGMDVRVLRRQVGMVFSKPSLPVGSIFDNVAMGPRMQGVHDRGVLAGMVEKSLKQVGMWERVADKQSEGAGGLSREDQQRLCVARVLTAGPTVLLFDEPTANMDYPSVGHFEDLICELAKKYTVLLAAQTPQQASHVADDTAFFWEGKLIESGPTEHVLTEPKSELTERYVTGRYE